MGVLRSVSDADEGGFSQRDYSLRAIFNALRYMVRASCRWRMMPNDLPPWFTVQQQAQRWIRVGCFEAMAHDLRKVLRLLAISRPHSDERVCHSNAASNGNRGQSQNTSLARKDGGEDARPTSRTHTQVCGPLAEPFGLVGVEGQATTHSLASICGLRSHVPDEFACARAIPGVPRFLLTWPIPQTTRSPTKKTRRSSGFDGAHSHG